jgi:hypothetical protein
MSRGSFRRLGTGLLLLLAFESATPVSAATPRKVTFGDHGVSGSGFFPGGRGHHLGGQLIQQSRRLEIWEPFKAAWMEPPEGGPRGGTHRGLRHDLAVIAALLAPRA